MGTLQKSYVKDENLVTRCIAGETIIVPVRNLVADLNSIFTLNETGSAIWQWIDGKRSVDQIVHAVADEFEVTDAEAIRDLLAFLSGLEQAGLIHPREIQNDVD